MSKIRGVEMMGKTGASINIHIMKIHGRRDSWGDNGLAFEFFEIFMV
jgi:hypothetical protein